MAGDQAPQRTSDVEQHIGLEQGEPGENGRQHQGREHDREHDTGARRIAAGDRERRTAAQQGGA
jgi:hypothetical protein